MKNNKIKLQYLIVGVTLLAFILTSIVSIWSGYKLNKANLGESAMITNRVYAQKVAETANNYLAEQQKILKVNTKYIAERIDDQSHLEKHADFIRNQTSAFNSIAIVNNKAVVLATSPQSLDLVGVKLTAEATKKAIKEQKPMISQPYTSVSGRLIVFVTTPIFSEKNEYLGLIGGTIYLKEKNILYKLLGAHPYDGQSTVYVVDRDGTIIYDERKKNIARDLPDNDIINMAIHKKTTGVVKGENTENQIAFAGYAHVKNADWMVIAQRPASAVEAPAKQLFKQMFLIALPFLAISLIIVIFLSYRIAKPLQRLAQLTESSKLNDEENNFRSVQAWYYEVIQLKEALIQSFSHLHEQVLELTGKSERDGLTGLYNRRTLDDRLMSWTKEQKSYAVIMFDVDHFKNVNDTYGHDVGDEVLRFIAAAMLQHVRTTDSCYRFGGEEFVILLPGASVDVAYERAEELRQYFEQTNSPTSLPIHISAGVAECPNDGVEGNGVLKKADQLLYEAKQNGRNQVRKSN